MSAMESELSEMLANNQSDKLKAYEYLRGIALGRVPPRQAGYKDVGHAAELIVKQAEASIEKRTRAFERKYPG